jgi:hypothetical protein
MIAWISQWQECTVLDQGDQAVNVELYSIRSCCDRRISTEPLLGKRIEKEVKMKFLAKLSFIFSLVIIFSGCSIRHQISKDYTKYLQNNQGGFQYPHTNLEAEYTLTENTVNHRYEFRAVIVGYAHLWIVEFGRLLEKTLESDDVQSAFKKLTKISDDGTPGVIKIRYNLIDYTFEGYEARVKLQVTVIKNGTIILDKSYFEKGVRQGGKMFWGGAFAMKNAVQQSTKSAIDNILSQSLNDMLSTL